MIVDRFLRNFIRQGNEVDMSKAEELLKMPDIIAEFVGFAHKAGIVGEEQNLAILKLCTVSRKVKRGRFHVDLREESAAGKSTLADFVFSTLPDEVKLDLTGGASDLALMYGGDMMNKVALLDEADTLDEEIRKLLRVLMTRDEASRLVTQGTPGEGFTSEPIKVDASGFVCIQAGIKVIANLADYTRFFALFPDVSEQQTKAITRQQAKSWSQARPGLESELKLWQEADRLLKPYSVVIPFAESLERYYTGLGLERRRDVPRLMSLVASCAVLHQKNRQIQGDTLIASLRDYEMVYRWCSTVFERHVIKLTKKQMEVLDYIKEKCEGKNFTSTSIETGTKIPHTTVWRALQALSTVGYIKDNENGTYKFESAIGHGLPLPAVISHDMDGKQLSIGSINLNSESSDLELVPKTETIKGD